MKESTIDPIFGQMVGQEMKKRGDTRAIAAAQMEISTSMLSDLLTGQPRNYTMSTLKRICEYAHLSADAIMGLEETPDENKMLHIASRVTGLSPRAIELLAMNNQSEWAAESGRLIQNLPDQRRDVVNKLLECRDTYDLITKITVYFKKVEHAKEPVQPSFDPIFIDALEVIKKRGFDVVNRVESAEKQRGEVVDKFKALIKMLSGEDGLEKNE